MNFCVADGWPLEQHSLIIRHGSYACIHIIRGICMYPWYLHGSMLSAGDEIVCGTCMLTGTWRGGGAQQTLTSFLAKKPPLLCAARASFRPNSGKAPKHINLELV